MKAYLSYSDNVFVSANAKLFQRTLHNCQIGLQLFGVYKKQKGISTKGVPTIAIKGRSKSYIFYKEVVDFTVSDDV